MIPQNDRHTGFEHVAALVTHLRLAWLLKHLPPRLVWAAYVSINGFVTIGLLALLRTSSSSRPWQKPPAPVTPSLVMQLGSSAAMLLSRSRQASDHLPPRTAVLMVRQFWLPRSRFQLPAL